MGEEEEVSEVLTIEAVVDIPFVFNFVVEDPIIPGEAVLTRSFPTPTTTRILETLITSDGTGVRRRGPQRHKTLAALKVTQRLRENVQWWI